MNVKKMIIDALRPINVPVTTLTGNNNNSEYIIINEYNQSSSLNADDKEMSTRYFYQVDVFTSGDFTTIVAEVESRLKEAGFKRMFSSESYDNEAQKYRKILRFSYATEIE
ncbi:hypothetical protein [Halolactibacillus sp. JCM 19043]|uniref:hypothetical protein n=1 Tax=Halolactibacillus sp. JCM 19043 TaxID=1460638 RepID=UPI000781FE36|nr:hypothetical protein [Halolactibacillus sp. JCM 19043]